MKSFNKLFFILLFMFLGVSSSLYGGVDVTCGECPSDGDCNTESKCESYSTCHWQGVFWGNDKCRDKECSDNTNETSCNSDALGCHWESGWIGGGCQDGLAPNNPPTANAGSNQSVAVGNTVTLDGSGSSDSDGSITNYKWTEGSTVLYDGSSSSFTKSDFTVGTHNITLTVTDDDGDTDSDDVTITITVTNNPPNAVDDTAITSINNTVSIDVLANDSDPDSDPISIKRIVSGPSHGTATISGNKIDYTPASGYTGTDSFVYRIEDEHIYRCCGMNLTNRKIDDATVHITVSATGVAPSYDNRYSCGIFDDVITTFGHLHIGDGDPSGDVHVCNSGLIAYSGIIQTTHSNQAYCSSSGCGGTLACSKDDLPLNKIDYTVHTSSRLGTSESAPSGALHDMEYGDFNGNFNLTLEPIYTYSDNTDINITLLGDVELSGSGNVLSLEPGDYYFHSLKFSGSNPSIALPDGGPVRIFIANDLSISSDGLSINSAGSADDLLFYVEGDIDFKTSGKPHNIKAFLYSKSSIKIDTDIPSFSFHGAMAAEGDIYISGSHPTFVGEDADSLGYGECQMCYSDIKAGGMSFSMRFCPGVSMSMFQTIEVPIQTDETLLNTTVEEAHKASIFSFSMFNRNQVRDQDNNIVRRAVNSTSGLSAGAMGMNMSMFSSKVVTYPLGDSNGTYGPTDSSNYQQLYNRSMFSFDFCKWYASLAYVAHYETADGKHYDIQIGHCDEPTVTDISYVTGPFDAWDTFRDHIITPPPSSQRKISTKIASESFNLSLASLDSSLSSYDTKSGVGSIDVAIYPYDSSAGTVSTTSVSTESVSFDVTSTAHVHSATFNVDPSLRTVVVGFKMCASYNSSTGIYTLSNSCSGSLHVCDYESSSPVWRVCYSSDVFAIRPNKFDLSIQSAPITSAEDQNFSVTSKRADDSYTMYYTPTSSDYALNITPTVYQTNYSVPSTPLHGSASVSSFSFTTNPTDVNISFDDVGYVNLRLEDRHWADVDIGDTPSSCNDNESLGGLTIPHGRYICGDTNATFIPDHFELSLVKVHNANSSGFTYMSNDLNMSAKISLRIRAKNKLNAVTQNFDSASWENPVTFDMNLSSSSTTIPSLQKNMISNQKIGFSSGVHTIDQNETNTSKNLLFSLQRVKNMPLNPVVVNGSNVNVSVRSNYGGSVDVNGSSTATQNITFIYGRTHATRQRYDSNSGVAKIYYEVYCYDTDANGNTCNKTLLPNGINSKQTNDIRWFVNPNHNSLTDGNVTSIEERGSIKAVSETARNTTDSSITKITLRYNEQYGYPYKTTMQNGASGWLIYDPNDASVTKNRFSVEFTKAGVGWNGQGESANSSSTRDPGTAKTNRRSRW